MKRLSFTIYINVMLAALFSFFCLSPHADISVLALPVSLLFTLALAYVSIVALLKKESYKAISVSRRFFQYEPFVLITAFVIHRAGVYDVPLWQDITTSILWFLVTISAFVVLHFLSEKRVFALSEQWSAARLKNQPKEIHGIKRVGIEILEWIDALVQAVFTIALLNIFIFQLYEIPSESMVPTFLIKDRVAVFKTLAGPKLPLSRVGLPYLQTYKRGDIVVFRNPHYKNDRKNEVKTFLSQFVYMLTLTFVKTNVDENGQLKADPLVKRITALPGEQIMLMDGALYARTKDSPEFTLVEADSDWAAWNLRALPAQTQHKIDRFVISAEQYQNTLAIEEERRNLDLAAAKAECLSLAAEFESLARTLHPDSAADLSETELQKFLRAEDLYEYNLFSYANDTTIKLLGTPGGAQWFYHFLNDWHKALGNLSLYSERQGVTGSQLVGGDLYTDSRFRLNILAKLVFARIVIQNTRLMTSGISVSEWTNDSERAKAFEKARLLHDYLYFMDQRNMGIFPANDANGNPSYIPEHCYFMMGDNRYNSLDMRHSYEQTLEALTSYDPYSVTYLTNMEPQYVSRSRIQGKASLRIWPLSRIGRPSKTKK